jgi:hypothetical protein
VDENDPASPRAVDPFDDLAIDALVHEAVGADNERVGLVETASEFGKEINEKAARVVGDLVEGPDEEKRAEVDRVLTPAVASPRVLDIPCKREADPLIPPKECCRPPRLLPGQLGRRR